MLLISIPSAAVDLKARTPGRPTYTVFDVPGAKDTIPAAMNTNGDVAGYYDIVQHGDSRGFIRHPDGSFETFHPRKWGAIVLNGLDADGTAAGYYLDNTQDRGFLRQPSGKIVTFDPPGSTRTIVTGIAGGYITGGFDGTDGATHGFLRQPEGSFVAIDVPGYSFSRAIAYNKGSVIG